MKDREPNELTKQANSSNLGREGDIFMGEGSDGSADRPLGPDQPPRPDSGPHGPEQPLIPDQPPAPPEMPLGPDQPPPLEHADGSTDSDGDGTTPSEPDFSDERPEITKIYMEQAIARQIHTRELTDMVMQKISEPEMIARLEKAGVKNPDVEKIVAGIMDWEKLEQDTRRNQLARAKENSIIVPESLEELAQLVMGRATPEYRQNGDKCIINYKKDEHNKDTDEVISVNTENFLDWARNNYFLVHLNNPTAPVNFFSDIATNVRSQGYGSTISFYEISFTDSYYLKEVKDKEGNVVDRVEDSEYKALKTQMLTETFLLQLQRNPAITYYFQAKSQREEMLKALTEALAPNPLTRSDFFETTFSDPSMHGQSIYDQDETVKGKGKLEKKIEGNFLLGDATREALAVYMDIHSFEQLEQILGPDSPLFTLGYDKWNPITAKPLEGRLETAVDVVDKAHPNKRRDEWFDDEGALRLYAVDENGRYIEKRGADGKILKDEASDDIIYMLASGPGGKPHPEFMKYINIFTEANPDQRRVKEIRERITLSIMERNGLSYREAQIAELKAYSMAQIYGIAARNDTDAIGMDWWTRAQAFLDKRNREKSPKRNAPHGSKYNMQGFKRISLNIMEGIRDIRGRSLRSIIQGTDGKAGSKVNIRENPLKNKVDYETDENGIIFYDSTGIIASDIHARRFEVKHENRIEEVPIGNGKTQRKEVIATKVVYFDKDDQIVDVGEYKPKTKTPEKIAEPIEFKQGIQQSFLVNHLVVGSEIYEWIMRKKELALPELVTGYDNHGSPILNWDKINEIKGGIEHHFRYLLSTWGEINYAEVNVDWERVEARNGDGKLITAENPKTGKRKVLDEDWYVLDEKGNRTESRADPETFLRSREMTRLESMFGTDALVFIQAEIERQKLNTNKNVISVIDERTGKPIRVDISAAENPKDRSKFAQAVWQGAFDYLVASEIIGHRTHGSGDEYYDAEALKKAFDALRVGQVMEPAQIQKIIRKQTNTGTRKMYGQDLGYAFAVGGSGGIWKMFEAMFKDIVSGK